MLIIILKVSETGQCFKAKACTYVIDCFGMS